MFSFLISTLQGTAQPRLAFSQAQLGGGGGVREGLWSQEEELIPALSHLRGISLPGVYWRRIFNRLKEGRGRV